MNNFILDIGCGEGIKIERLLVKGKYIGIDIDIDNVKMVRSKLNDGYALVCASQQLPFRNSVFDEIHAYDVLEHVSEFENSCSEMVRCLKKGQPLIIEVPYHKSEKILLKHNPNYWEEVGHLRVVEEDVLKRVFNSFRVVKVQKKRGVQHMLLWYNFFRGGKIISSRGTCSNSHPILDRIGNLFDEDYLSLFLIRKHSFSKWLFLPLLLLSHVCGRFISQIIPKTIRFELKKL